MVALARGRIKPVALKCLQETLPMLAEYDVFLSHAWADGDRPREIAQALEAAGLKVWFDAAEIADFASITRAVQQGVAKSKALLAFYSKAYPARRACQWELTTAFLAAQQEGDPRQRVLVVNPEAGAGHIHPIELRDAKFAKAPASGDRAALQALAQAVRKQIDRLSGPLSDIRPLDSPVWYGMRPVGSTRFVGRLEELWRIHSVLRAADVVQVTGAPQASGGMAQVSGLGGVGKSLLAEEYALRFGPAYAGGIFWLHAYGNDDPKAGSGAGMGPEEREAERERQVQAFAGGVGLDVRNKTPAEVEGALARELERRDKPCLWVVDDVPGGLDGQALRRWFAPHPLARTLLTTRSREYGAQAAGIDLSVLPPDEAYQLLTSRRVPASDAEREQARLLAEDLGRHALALDVTGAALASFGETEPYRRFRAELVRMDKDVLDLAKTLADALPNGHEVGIAQTLLRSIEVLGAEGQDFLRLASVIAVAPIPGSLVTTTFQRADKLSDSDAQWRQATAFKQVTAASLAEVAADKADSRSVHTLVSRAIRFRDRQPERRNALRTAAMEALATEIDRVAGDFQLQGRVEFHIAHAREIVGAPATNSEADLVRAVAFYDWKRAAYVSAGALYRRELEFRRRVLGPEHRDTLGSMNNLAAVLASQGDLAGARKLQEETLAVYAQVQGPEHPETLAAMNNLAVTLNRQGEFAQARRLEEETLALRVRILGPVHPDTLSSMINLAATLRAQGDYAQARKLQEETLDVYARVQGLEHPDTLNSMAGLAAILRAQGDLAGARKLGEEALDVLCRVLGNEHPSALSSMRGLADTLRAQGDLTGARQLHQDVLAARRRLLGQEHPDTLASMDSVASTLWAQGDLSGARKLVDEVLAVRRRVQGPEHPDTLGSMSNLAAVLIAQGDLARASRLNEEALAIQRRVLGPEHPDTLGSMNNLAAVLIAQGDLAGARRLNEEAFAIRRRVLGPEHPDTLSSMNNLAGVLSAQGDSAGARNLHEEALAIQRRVLGPEHPETLGSMHNVACALSEQGDMAGARLLHEKALAIRRRVLGPDHPDTLTSMNSLAVTLSAQWDLEGARKLLEEALAVRRRALEPHHSDTTDSAFRLFIILHQLGEHEAAWVIQERDLMWLLGRDPVTLSARQREIRHLITRVEGLRTWHIVFVGVHLIAKVRTWLARATSHLAAIFGIAGRARHQ
jgi:tetratricopeptide (TPR) repeat protein